MAVAAGKVARAVARTRGSRHLPPVDSYRQDNGCTSNCPGMARGHQPRTAPERSRPLGSGGAVGIHRNRCGTRGPQSCQRCLTCTEARPPRPPCSNGPHHKLCKPSRPPLPGTYPLGTCCTLPAAPARYRYRPRTASRCSSPLGRTCRCRRRCSPPLAPSPRVTGPRACQPDTEGLPRSLLCNSILLGKYGSVTFQWRSGRCLQHSHCTLPLLLAQTSPCGK